MAKILGNFHMALVIGVILVIAAMAGLHREAMDTNYWVQFLRYLHVFCGILWIGLLYYFNFVQIPTMPKIDPPELKAGVSKFIAPAALFWFRWAAIATVLFGLTLPEIRQGGSVGQMLMLEDPYRTIGIGMWLGLIMAANVWLVIWPNQKRALGIVAASDEAKAKSASVAMMASRTNLILSLPMLYCMIMGAHVG
jgi:uncharacterized membrane protein